MNGRLDRMGGCSPVRCDEEPLLFVEAVEVISRVVDLDQFDFRAEHDALAGLGSGCAGGDEAATTRFAGPIGAAHGSMPPTNSNSTEIGSSPGCSTWRSAHPQRSTRPSAAAKSVHSRRTCPSSWRRGRQFGAVGVRRRQPGVVAGLQRLDEAVGCSCPHISLPSMSDHALWAQCPGCGDRLPVGPTLCQRLTRRASRRTPARGTASSGGSGSTSPRSGTARFTAHARRVAQSGADRASQDS